MREVITKEHGSRRVVTFDDSQEVKDKVFEYLITNFYFEYGSFTGECIMQTDNPQIYAPEILSNIADDIIKFKVEWPDEK